MEVILLAIVTFIFAIDQFSLTEVAYRPMVACPIIGAILGDVQTGLVIGGTYELMMIGNMPIGGAQPANAVLGAICAMIFAVKAGMDIEAALGAAVIFSTFGTYVVTLVFTIASGFNAMADESASKADIKGVNKAMWAHYILLGGCFAIIAVLALVAGEAMKAPLEAISEKASWFMGGLSAAGGMMRYVGFGVLMKIMMSNEMWGFYLAGFAFALIVGNIPALAGATLLIVAFIGFAIAYNDYLVNVKIKNSTANVSMGGVSDGI